MGSPSSPHCDIFTKDRGASRVAGKVRDEKIKGQAVPSGINRQAICWA